jgi:hypothetical protein
MELTGAQVKTLMPARHGGVVAVAPEDVPLAAILEVVDFTAVAAAELELVAAAVPAQVLQELS